MNHMTNACETQEQLIQADYYLTLIRLPCEWPTQLDVAQVLTLGLVALQHRLRHEGRFSLLKHESLCKFTREFRLAESAARSFYNLQRGQECAGIVTSDGASPPTYTTHKGMGLVSTAFPPKALTKLRYGNLGICQTHYSTTGISELQNCQPFVVDTLHGKIAVAHNGELFNAHALRKKVMRHGVGLSTSSDSELITQLLALTPPMEELDSPDWVARIKNLMIETPTSYSLLVMFKDVIYAVRDPYGNRPLCIGQLVPISKLHSPGFTSFALSHEYLLTYYREVLPGEIVQISRHGVTSLSVVPRPEGGLPAFCIFEYVYFARPDSIFEGQMVYTVRQRCERQLAVESPTDADVVSTVPESATPAALGYAQQIKHLTNLDSPVNLKHTYVGETVKPHAATGPHQGGFSTNQVPPCYMGINIPTKEELIANKPEFEDIAAGNWFHRRGNWKLKALPPILLLETQGIISTSRL
ncbi:hypothetical protein ACER0C_002470 [Sarotherodon galilaeus]